MSKEIIPGIDEDKLSEIIRETSIVKADVSVEQLQQLKANLGEGAQDVELRQLQGLLDLYNTVINGVITYHQRYRNKPNIEKDNKSEIPKSNKDWHKANKLKPFASLDEKVKWHIDHVAHCNCSGGTMPKYVRKEIEKRMQKI